jgi:hypothetical protein
VRPVPRLFDAEAMRAKGEDVGAVHRGGRGRAVYYFDNQVCGGRKGWAREFLGLEGRGGSMRGGVARRGGAGLKEMHTERQELKCFSVPPISTLRSAACIHPIPRAPHHLFQ